MHDCIPLGKVCVNILGMPRLGTRFCFGLDMPTIFFGTVVLCVDMLAHTKPADMCV